MYLSKLSFIIGEGCDVKFLHCHRITLGDLLLNLQKIVFDIQGLRFLYNFSIFIILKIYFCNKYVQHTIMFIIANYCINPKYTKYRFVVRAPFLIIISGQVCFGAM